MIATIKRFVCNYWFGSHKYYYMGTVTIHGITEEVWCCGRCGKYHIAEVCNHGNKLS